jgi:hypothetical protein
MSSLSLIELHDEEEAPPVVDSFVEEVIKLFEKHGITIDPDRDRYKRFDPVACGQMYRTHDNEPCFALKLETDATPPERLKELEKQGWKARDHYYRERNTPRMVLYCTPEHMAKFHMQPDDFEYKVAKRIGGFEFDEMMGWINKSITNRFSIRTVMNMQKKPGRSIMIVYFEDQKDAAIFRMFKA